MNLEMVLKIKEAADRHQRSMRGILLGALKRPDFEVNVDPEQTLEERYNLTSQRLEGLARFVNDSRNPGWQVTPGVLIATIANSPTPDVWLRFRRTFTSASTGKGREAIPGVLVADYFDMASRGSFWMSLLLALRRI